MKNPSLAVTAAFGAAIMTSTAPAVGEEPGRIPSPASDPEVRTDDRRDEPVDSQSIPGDQFEGTRIPGDQFSQESIPGDQFEGTRIPGDQFEGSRRIPGAATPGDVPVRDRALSDHSANAQPRPVNARLIAHFPLDASPENVVGESGVVVTNSGAAPEPVPGRFGQAYRFGESAVIAAPLDIDFTTYPRITITAWVKLAQEREDSGGYILSTGRASRAPALMFSNERLRGESAGRKPVLYEGDPIPPETWTFVAGVWDYEAHTLRLYNGEAARTFTNPDLDVAVQSERKRNQPQFRRPDDDEAEPQRYVFIGARDFKAGRAARDVAIDDVRIYAGALDDTAIAAIRDGSATRVAGRDRIGETEKNLQTGGGPARAASADTMPIDPVRHGPAGMDADENSADIERQTVVFDGTGGPGRTRYTLWTTGRLEPVEGRLDGHAVTINPDDTLDGTGRAARGYVGTAKDGYYVYGDIGKITLTDPGAAKVYVNGRLYTDIAGTAGMAPASDSEQAENNTPAASSGTQTRHQALESATASLSYGDRVYRIGDVSGSRGSYSNSVTLFADQAILSDVQTTELSDKPCKVKIGGARLSDGEIVKYEVENCREGRSLLGDMDFSPTSIADPSLGIVALQVCTASNIGQNKRVKGVRVTTRAIKADGGLGSNARTQELFERANCGPWADHSRCEGGTVATGVKLYFADGTRLAPKDYLTGVALMCSELRPAE